MSEPSGERSPRPLVLDTSVALKWHLEEKHSDEAARLLDAVGGTVSELFAPSTPQPEFFNAFWQRRRRSEMSPEEVGQVWDDFRAALKQIGIHLSSATCGRILATNRKIYGLEKPRGGNRAKVPMPFFSSRRHEYWSVDLRYLDMVDENLIGGPAYAITVVENYSRMVLASTVSPTQDLSAYLSVLYQAIEKHGSPRALVTDSGSIFLANRAKDIYGMLGITKYEIERGQPWQNYSETTLTVPMECPSMSSHLQ